MSAALAPRQTGANAWRAADMADPATWTWTLTDAEIGEILHLSLIHI